MKTRNIFMVIFIFLIFNSMNGQTTVFEDPLTNGTTSGTLVGGYFNSEGYRPNKGSGHILYSLPYQVPNGYLEFQIKGFTPALIEDPEQDADNGFFGMYDGRGITEPILYFDDFKTNFFRWNFHYRQNRSAFKSVIQCSAPTPERINAPKAVFGYTSEGLIAKDWGEEPQGLNYVTNSTSWYTVKAEWKDKKFTISINGTEIWSAEGPYDYVPIDHRIWLGSAPGVADKYLNLVAGITYRNVKVVSYENIIQDSLSISPLNKNVNYNSGSTDFSISSNTNWNAISNDSWISVSPTSGEEDAVVSALYQSNPSNNERTGTFEITTGKINQTITIVQSGKPLKYINLLPSLVNVDFTSGESIVVVESNVDWVVSYSSNWVSVAPYDSTGNDTLLVSFVQNNNSNSRTAQITVSNDSIIASFSIVQAGNNNYINLSPPSWNVSKNSGSVSFYVESNQNWSVIPKASWLSTSFNGANGNASFTVNFSANTDTSSRIGIILVQSEYILDSISVIQSGSEPVELLVSINPPSSGTVTGNGIYGKGASATLRAIANSGWKFDNWEESGTILSSDSVFTYKLLTSKEFVANFSVLTDIDDKKLIPEEYFLSQNYPNPFNPSTNITFHLPEAAEVILKVYNSLGQELYTLVNNSLGVGSYTINFSASKLTSGIYIYSLVAVGNSGKQFVDSKKLILMK